MPSPLRPAVDLGEQTGNNLLSSSFRLKIVVFVCVDIFSVVRENEMPKERSTMVSSNDINTSRFLIALFGLLTCLVAVVQSGEAGKQLLDKL